MKVFRVLLLLAFLCPAVVQADQKTKPLNFVFFLVDDLGYMDVGANHPGTFYETPHIDRLAAEGMRFTKSIGS